MLSKKDGASIEHPSILLIIGARDSGKSAFGHMLLEEFYRQGMSVYMVVLLDKERIKQLIPEWVNIVADIQEVPEDAVVLVDEASIRYHAHRWHTGETAIMENIVNLSRQRKQTIIFITHITRKFSITLLDIDVLICKEPGPFHSVIERSDFRKFVTRAERGFRGLQLDKEQLKRYSYVVSRNYTGLVVNGLCSYWTKELSTAFARHTKQKEREHLIDIYAHGCMKKKKQMICSRCGYVWKSRVENPKFCPDCGLRLNKKEKYYVKEVTCGNCGYVWKSRVENPLECPSCKVRLVKKRVIKNEGKSSNY